MNCRLATFILLGAFAFGEASALTRVSESRVVKADQDVKAITAALEQFKGDLGRYPTQEEGLAVLATPTDALKQSGKYRSTGYVTRLPRDPWGAEYQYRNPGERNVTSIDVLTLGADGQLGGEGINGDFGNWPGSFDSWYEQQRRKARNDSLLYSFMFGAPFGLCIGLPIYIAGIRKAKSAGASTKAALSGFHLGVLLYLAAVFPALGVFVILWFQ